MAAIKRNKSYFSFIQKKNLLSSFVHSHLAYPPLVWMFYNRTMDKKINKVQERALRILYDNDTLTFLELLEMDGAFTVHQRNIQILLLEMFKAKNNLEPSLLKGIFQRNEYRGPVLRSSKVFMRPSVRMVKDLSKILG